MMCLVKMKVSFDSRKARKEKHRSDDDLYLLFCPFQLLDELELINGQERSQAQSSQLKKQKKHGENVKNQIHLLSLILDLVQLLPEVESKIRIYLFHLLFLDNWRKSF